MDDKENDDTITNDDMTVTVRLRKPVTHNGHKIESLTFPAEALVRHLEASDKGTGDIQKATYLMAELVSQPYRVITNLTIGDFNRAAAVMNVLVGKDLEIGGTS